MDGRAGFGEMPGRASVVEMNVTEENVPDVVRRKARDPHFESERFEGGISSGIEKRDPVVRLQGDRADDPRLAEMAGIENVNHGLRGLAGIVRSAAKPLSINKQKSSSAIS